MSIERAWRYRAEDAHGKVIKGALNALDLRQAAARLKEQGLAPINLEEISGKGIKLIPFSRPSSLSLAELAQFCERLADLLNADVTVTRSLSLIHAQPGPKAIRDLAERLHTKLRKGETLTAALASDPASPPRLMIALSSSGEALGDLGGQFSRLAEAFKSRAALQREIIGQLIYPAALLVLIIATLIFLSFFVLPEFETVFLTAGANPPPETRFVLAAGAFIRAWWAPSALVILGIIVTLRFAFHFHRDRFEAIALGAPLLGRFIRQADTARYCRSLGELLCGGAPLAKAMPIARAAVGNQRIRNRIAAMEADIRNGVSLSKAALQNNYITRDAVPFFELGEETGALGPMIMKAADYLESRITTVLKRIAALSGPIMTAMMGLITAGVIAAVMSGVLSLNDAVY